MPTLFEKLFALFDVNQDGILSGSELDLFCLYLFVINSGSGEDPEWNSATRDKFSGAGVRNLRTLCIRQPTGEGCGVSDA